MTAYSDVTSISALATPSPSNSHPILFVVRRTTSQPRNAKKVAAKASAGDGIASDGSRCPHATTSIPSASTESATVAPRTAVGVGRSPPGDDTPEVAEACFCIHLSLADAAATRRGCLHHLSSPGDLPPG